MDNKVNVIVKTKDGKVKHFLAKATYELTPDQKHLWETRSGQQKITNARIEAIREDETVKDE